jgi:hypothetical protein
MDQRGMILIGVFLVLTITVIGLLWERSVRIAETHLLQRDLAYLREAYPIRVGASSQYGSYVLVSVNGGKDWLALDPTTHALIGTANPARLAHLNGLDALTDYVHRHGPIGSRPISAEDIEVLQGADFGVTRPSD